MIHRKQSGALHVILLLLGVVFVAGALGWAYWQSRQGPSTSENAVQQETQTDTTTTVQADTHAMIAHVEAVDPAKIPLGDGKVTTSAKKGYVMSCNTSFRGGGAMHAGNWIGSSTWNSESKLHVAGHVSWPSASVQISASGANRDIKTNSLPVKGYTGIFPIQSGDPAYRYDRNPNSIAAQSISLSVPKNPTKASSPNCLPMGAIGYMTNGVAIYNALDDAGRDAAAHEVQDACDGHPQMRGEYHYHSLSGCVLASAKNGDLVGYALDGFGVYVEKDGKGNLLTNNELDECHGRTSTVTWDGKAVAMYHYVMTLEYPYTLGCFAGAPSATRR